jgi:hypothetical protein
LVRLLNTYAYFVYFTIQPNVDFQSVWTHNKNRQSGFMPLQPTGQRVLFTVNLHDGKGKEAPWDFDGGHDVEGEWEMVGGARRKVPIM